MSNGANRIRLTPEPVLDYPVRTSAHPFVRLRVRCDCVAFGSRKFVSPHSGRNVNGRIPIEKKKRGRRIGKSQENTLLLLPGCAGKSARTTKRNKHRLLKRVLLFPICSIVCDIFRRKLSRRDLCFIFDVTTEPRNVCYAAKLTRPVFPLIPPSFPPFSYFWP